MQSREEKAKYDKQYRQDHKLEAAEYRKQYCQKNRLKITEQQKQWCRNNKLKVSEIHKRWRQRNKLKYAEWRKQYYRKRRETWIEFFKDIRCTQCGYDKCFEAIDFHHIDPTQKEFAISPMIQRKATPERLMAVAEEIKKCIALCANCHRELHANQRGQGGAPS